MEKNVPSKILKIVELEKSEKKIAMHNTKSAALISVTTRQESFRNDCLLRYSPWRRVSRR